ncbi:hypothetical protein E2C01_045444 [Portunus trituberculatus]|uniref:Uncharacterized protein n=1 Tax=Portunus trituberculatus TaxID=210409 RepID=A0A5B7G2A1_PORTR|nr:hypothetical protein [Portunus trituberculatus]
MDSTPEQLLYQEQIENLQMLIISLYYVSGRRPGVDRFPTTGCTGSMSVSRNGSRGSDQLLFPTIGCTGCTLASRRGSGGSGRLPPCGWWEESGNVD